MTEPKKYDIINYIRKDIKMKQEEYVKTIVVYGKMVNVGMDDYGQQYFIELNHLSINFSSFLQIA